MYTVISTEPAVGPRRALVAAVTVLLLTTALAALLVRGRHVVHLGTRLAPDGWPISFQPPGGWEEFGRQEESIECRDLRDLRNPKHFSMHLVTKPPDLSAAEVATGVMSLHLARFLAGGDMALPEDAQLGLLSGGRVSMPSTGDYVHVGLVPPDKTKAVILRYHARLPFTERDVQTCRRIVESVRVVNRP